MKHANACGIHALWPDSTLLGTHPAEEQSEPPIITCAEIIFECLLREGVDTVFGYPGGANLYMYRYLPSYPQINHILVRHEQGGAHAADGYARSSGRVGVVWATSGPGALNLVTGLATAMADSVPVVAFTGQVPTAAIGTDAFQESDVIGSTMSVVKHSYLVTDVNDLARVIREAFYVARSGRPGPSSMSQGPATNEFIYPDPPRLRSFTHPKGRQRRRTQPLRFSTPPSARILIGRGVSSRRLKKSC